MKTKIKTILITGFDPFNNESTNPSYEAVKLLDDEIDNVRIIKKEIPTSFFTSRDLMISYISEYNPDVIINVGQAGRRDKISIESKAYNLIDCNIKDNNGNMIQNKKIVDDGSDILDSTLPINKIFKNLKNNNIPSYISINPGRFVCNYIMYSMLELTKSSNIMSGFIHVPYSKEQAILKGEDTPYMEIEDMKNALTIIIKSIIN